MDSGQEKQFKKMTIHPTHTCFDDAVEFIEELIKEHPDKLEDIKTSLLLVHGICLLPNGQRYAHGWVEDNKTDSCYFKGIVESECVFLQADRPGFYENFKVQETTKYTLWQVHLENMLSGTFGPWDKKYLALTGKDRKIYLQEK